MPVSIHHQYYLGKCPVTRYYRGLERRADFIMVSGERERERTIEWNVEWSVGRSVARLVGLVGWFADCLASWLGYGSRVLESIAGACRFLRVLRISRRPHAGETRCLRAHHVQHTRSRERTRTHTLTQVTYAFRRVLYERSIFSGNFLEDLRPDFVGLFSCRANGGIFITMARLLSLWCIALLVRCTHVYAECRFRVRANIWHEVLGFRETRRTRNW